MKKILLLTPPFTQLNAPYPATAFLKGSLKKYGYTCNQLDLGITIIRYLFSRKGLERVKEIALVRKIKLPINFYKYICTIDQVINFLAGGDSSFAYKIISRSFLPEGGRFFILEEMELSFDGLSVTDGAKYLCGLYIDDLTEILQNSIVPDFQLSRYKEKIARSQADFGKIDEQIFKDDFITELLYQELAKINWKDFSLVGVTIPFPGNLVSSLQIANYLKKNHSTIKVLLGGGYINTELRQISDPGIFKYIDYIIYDDGEMPLVRLLKHLNGEEAALQRTLELKAGILKYHEQSESDFKHDELGDPDYEGIEFSQYFTLYETPNTMQRLWSEKGFFKLRMAHGCYWHKCAFCDVSLDYIKGFWQLNAERLIKQVRKGVEQTGVSGIHFIDEALPPALVKAFCLLIIKENISIQWWGNIRLDDGFTPGLCNLMQKAGCIAVVAGLEAVTDSVLKSINKGVTVRKAAEICKNFKDQQILVHTYLIYALPKQTIQDVVDSLEILRQLFELELIDSVYWHRFALTIHSPIYAEAENFNIIPDKTINSFGNNDVNYQDLGKEDLDSIAYGLKKAVYNFAYGVGIEFPVWQWFDQKVPKPTFTKNLIKKYLKEAEIKRKQIIANCQSVWLGGKIVSVKKVKAGKGVFVIIAQIEGFNRIIEWEFPEALFLFLRELLSKSSFRKEQEKLKLSYFEQKFPKTIGLSFEEFLDNEIFEDLVDNGLLLL